MGWFARTTRVACNTSTGTQDITISGIGSSGDMKAAIFEMNGGTTDGTAADHKRMGYGFTDGTRQRVLACTSEDAQGTSDVASRLATDEVVMILDPGDGTVEGEANFDSWITDGVRINWGNAPTSAYLLTVTIIGGSDVQAHVNTVEQSSSSVDVTAPGFEPDAVVAFGGYYGFTDAARNELLQSVGVCHNDGAGGVTQRCVYEREDSAGTTALNMKLNTSKIYGVLLSGGSEYNTIALSSFDSQGFTSTVTGAVDSRYAYLALNFGGVAQAAVATVSMPTATGSDPQTWPGFQPSFLMEVQTILTLVDTVVTNAAAECFYVSTNDASNQYCAGGGTKDNFDTSDTISISSAKSVALYNGAAVSQFAADWTSFDATGYTRNFTKAAATVRYAIGLAIGDVAGGGFVPYPQPRGARAGMIAMDGGVSE